MREAARLAEQAIEVGKDDAGCAVKGCPGGLVSLLARMAPPQAPSIGPLTLNPNSAHALMASGYVSYLRNRPEAAIEAFRRAMQLSPLDPLNFYFTGGIAFAHLTAGRYAEAVEWADRSLNESPRWLPALRVKVVACAHLGLIEKARELLRQTLELQPDLTIAGLNAYPGMTVTPEIFSMWEEGFP